LPEESISEETASAGGADEDTAEIPAAIEPAEAEQEASEHTQEPAEEPASSEGEK
jgi:hypothetical protein